MMKLWSSILSLLFVIVGLHTSCLEEVRNNFSKLASDKTLCEKLMVQLEKTKGNSATELAYLGSLQTIWANHVFNPLGKLKTFKKGKMNIEAAIDKEPQNTELRFIRLSVQKMAPSFLGYNSKISEDQNFIINNRSQIKSKLVNKYIEQLLKN